MAKIKNNPTLNPKRLADDGLTPQKSFLPFTLAVIIVLVLMGGVFTLRHFMKTTKDLYTEDAVVDQVTQTIGTFNDANFRIMKLGYTDDLVKKYLENEADLKKFKENFWAGREGVKMISHSNPHIDKVKQTADLNVEVQADKHPEKTRNYEVKMKVEDNNWKLTTPFLLEK